MNELEKIAEELSDLLFENRDIPYTRFKDYVLAALRKAEDIGRSDHALDWIGRAEWAAEE